jgi:hypothetical protein
MTLRHRIIREKPTIYVLHSVSIYTNGAAKNYSEKPEAFAFGDAITVPEPSVAL